MDTQSAGDELRQIAKLHPYIYVDRLERMAKAWTHYKAWVPGTCDGHPPPDPDIPDRLKAVFVMIYNQGIDDSRDPSYG